jgi:hypothetical protein
MFKDPFRRDSYLNFLKTSEMMQDVRKMILLLSSKFIFALYYKIK